MKLKLYFILIIIILVIFLLLNNNINEGFTHNPPKVTEANLRLDNTCSDTKQIYKIDRFDYYTLPANSNGVCPDNYERYNYSYRNSPEVFFVNTSVTQANANSVCTGLGSGTVQATFHDLLNAFHNGMNVCIDGWVSDKSNFSFFPINNSADFGNGIMNPDCKGNTPSMYTGVADTTVKNAQLYSNAKTETDSAGVYCYGMKRSVDGTTSNFNKTTYNTTNNIAYFNKTKKSMNENIYCLPTCRFLGSNFNTIFHSSTNDPSICLTSNCTNTPQLSNTIKNSWNAVCAILTKTNNSYTRTLSNINTVNSNINNQYNIIDTHYTDLNTTINGWHTSDNAKYTLALPFLSNIRSDHSNILDIRTQSSNNYNTLLREKIAFDSVYTGFACSNY
jgi:hypothetical protein